MLPTGSHIPVNKNDDKIIMHVHFLIIIVIQLYTCKLGGYSYAVKRHFQQYFSYFVAVNFIGGGN